MAQEIEIADLDLRYEGYRMKNPAQERKMLVSIVERGIEEPLQGVDLEDERVLLNGFKRYRCARKLGLGLVPYTSLGSDEATGIVAVLRGSSEKGLCILEEARFIDELAQSQRMCTAEISETLSRSKSWVAMRLGLIREMSTVVRTKILAGAFPVYSYMYTLRPFMRMAGVSSQDLETFICAVSGKKLSIRELDQLANGYFRGPDWFRQEVDSGNLTLVLDRIREVPQQADSCSGFEGVALREMATLAKYMRRVIGKSQDRRLCAPTRAFRAQASLLLAGILSRTSTFQQTLRELHDRVGQA